MSLGLAPQPVPLSTDADGVVRVGGTRVTLETIVEAFQRGATPEEISSRYPAVSLADIYTTISFYLGNREEVEAYLHDRLTRQEDDERSRWDQSDVRARLLARRPR